jgi:hypothetical protein
MDNNKLKLLITLLFVKILQTIKANTDGLKSSSVGVLTTGNITYNIFDNDDLVHNCNFIQSPDYTSLTGINSKKIQGKSQSITNNFTLSNVPGSTFQQTQLTEKNISDESTGKFNFALDKNGLVKSYNNNYTDILADRLILLTDNRTDSGSQKYDNVKISVRSYFERVTVSRQSHLFPPIHPSINKMLKSNGFQESGIPLHE